MAVTQSEVPLSASASNRNTPTGDNDAVVRAIFTLDSEERRQVVDMKLDSEAKLTANTRMEFRISKRKDGTIRTGFSPELTRDPKPFEKLAKEIAAADARMIAARTRSLSGPTGSSAAIIAFGLLSQMRTD
ncbi:MAG: hypothetical protein ABJA11_05720 [Pseudolysinimonas sp.]